MSRAPVIPGRWVPTWRARLTPVLSTLGGSALGGLPVIASAPVLPPFGLLMAISWRLLRPEMWHPWMALPLGLADDLLTGQPLGTGMTTWTLVFLALDRLDHVFRFRGYWPDWLIAAGVGIAAVPAILPQIGMTIACFPAVERIAAMLDRWRLAR